MSGSWQGKILRVDLTGGAIAVEDLNRDWARKYIGGKGLGIRYFLSEIRKDADPLGEENVIVLMTSPLAGTPVSSSSKLTLVSKSPLTGTILDSSVGGSASARLKFAGFDGVVITGRAPRPSYLVIDDDKVELRDGAALKGTGIFTAEDALENTLGPDFSCITIGPAGENLVKFSCAGSEKYRQAGRGGLGAVLGSKNLKSIAIRGRGHVAVENAGAFLEEAYRLMKEEVLTADNLWAYSEGTPMLVAMANGSGLLPTRNFRYGVFEEFQNLSSDAVLALRKGKKACFGCALACGNYIKAKEVFLEGPEYETLALCGSNCGIGDLSLVAEFNRLCDDLGIDTISAGNVTAFAMELTEKKLKDFNITFGDKAEYLKVPYEIAYGEGPRAELSLGVKALAEKYGGAEFAMHVKGLEMPGYEPRGSWGMSLAYATSDRGACHLRAWPVASEAFGSIDPYTLEGKAELVMSNQNSNAVKFSLALCDFWAASMEALSSLTPFALGEKISPEDLMTYGERIWNLGRLFNVREGFRRSDDSLPQRLHREGLAGGVAGGKTIPPGIFEKVLLEYYALRGWNEQGVPTKEKLRQLQIEEELIAWV
jgi:aldehyde:ferredoxin oxidoreductase